VKTIHLADGLDLPAAQAAAQRYSFFGKPGSGKSNALGVLIEGLLDAGEQVIIFDPASIHWSYRVGRDGKKPAHNIAVIGGEHGDMPLVPSSGGLLADALAASSTSAVIDSSDLTLGDQRRLVTDFFERFFQAKKRHRTPVLVVLEEAHEYIPQNVQPGEARMFGAIQRAAKIGRNYGIGLATVDHRPQEVNKSIVNLSEFMANFQLVGAHERKAVKEWITNNDPERAGLENELPTLPRGTAQVYSPTWLKVYGKFAFPLKQTFDAGKTPERGAAQVKLKPIDIAGLRTSMETVEKEAEANNPKVLQKRIVELEKQLAAKPTAATKTVEVIKEVHVIPPKLKADLKAVRASLIKITHNLEQTMTVIHESAAKLEKIDGGSFGGEYLETRPHPAQVSPQKRFVAPVRRPESTDGVKLKYGCIKMINAIATSKTGTRTASQIATLTGIKVTGSTFANYKSSLVTGGYVEILGNEWVLTTAGDRLKNTEHVPETNEDLLTYWRPKLKAGAHKLLHYIVQEVGAGKTIEKEEWASAVSKHDGEPLNPDGSTLANYISLLVTNGLVVKTGRGEFTPGDVFT